MKYFLNIFGIQLFLGSVWSFYYSMYKVGFSLLAFASIILIPLIYNFLKKKMSGFKAAGLIFSVYFVGISLFCVSYLSSVFAPIETNIDKGISVYAFEQSLINSTQPCFKAYDVAFSKDIKYQDEQCSLIKEAKDACYASQQSVNSIIIPNSSKAELVSLLNEARTDAKNSLQGWENFFSMYNNQCISKTGINATDAKLNLISAVKNKYFMEMKIKKAKTIN